VDSQPDYTMGFLQLYRFTLQRLRDLVLLLESRQLRLVLDEEAEPLGTLTLSAHAVLDGLGVADR
jgi:hypothetical protein